MRYLADADGPAPRLVDVRVDDPETPLAQVFEGVERLALFTPASTRSTSPSSAEDLGPSTPPARYGSIAWAASRGGGVPCRPTCSDEALDVEGVAVRTMDGLG